MENKELINAFLRASKQSKEILNSDENEWNRIRNIMQVESDEEFEALKNGYKKGIITTFNEKNIDDFQKVFKILLKEGGKDLVGNSTFLDDSIFWQYDF